jgi:hypothetical protein
MDLETALGLMCIWLGASYVTGLLMAAMLTCEALKSE